MPSWLPTSLSPWDLALLLIASSQATAVAYLHHPRLKALMVSLPLPFTCVCLGLNRPVDVTNVAGMFLILGFFHGVHLLHARWRVPIVPTIAIVTLGYIFGGLALAPLLPPGGWPFWSLLTVLLLLGLTLYLRLPAWAEPGYRTPLPVYTKLPVVVGVVVLLVLLKRLLLGFATFFPMVSIVTAYEARRCLWTMCRQIPVMMLTMGPMLAVMRLTQGAWGTAGSLAAGWAAFLVIFVPLTRHHWSRDLAAANEEAAPLAPSAPG